MNIKQPFDLFIITCGRDIKLLRHFFLSYELFFRNPGKIHLFIWKKEEHLFDQINRPGNLVIHYKDAVEGLGEDDFRNQMYLKLISDQYVETNWYWVVDSDYLICSPLGIEDFFHDDSAYWFFRPWSGLPEQSWRTGSERFLGKEIPYLFMDAQSYVLNREVLRDLRASCDVSRILSCKPLPSEFVIYGAFAYSQHHEKYRWVNLDRDATLCAAYVVNQRPPTYCELDEGVNLSSIGSAKYAVLWSHWDKSEQKMVEFLIDAQIREFGEVRVEPDAQPLYLELQTSSLSRDDFIAIGGAYSDGWVKAESVFRLTVLMPCELVLKLKVPLCLLHNTTRLSLQTDATVRNFTLTRRNHILRIPLKSDVDNIVRLHFSGGMPEPDGGRRLYAQLTQMFVQPYGWNPLRRT
ncbi:hypothetical protein [Candidatus Methylomirabilis limnetica]|nr:hypothetical protein [Candidatus Methylomirabilis limnetica]